MGPKGSLRKINKFLELKSNENKNIKMYGKEKEGRKEGGDERKTKGRKEGKRKPTPGISKPEGHFLFFFKIKNTNQFPSNSKSRKKWGI